MNEEELKAIWKKDENFTVENFNFERIKENASKAHEKMRKIIKWEVSVNVLLCLMIAPLFFYFPRILIALPFLVATWIWYLWEFRRIYNYDADFQKFENVKTFLLQKEKLLTNYIKRIRYIGYPGMPILFVIFFVEMTSFEGIWKFPLNFILGLVSSEILAVAVFEFSIRKIYKSVLDELRNLLQQLND